MMNIILRPVFTKLEKYSLSLFLKTTDNLGNNTAPIAAAVVLTILINFIAFE